MEKLNISNFIESKNETGFLLLTEINEKLTKNGTPYCALSFSDGNKQITGNMWETTQNKLIEKGCTKNTIVLVEILPKMYKDMLTYEVGKVEKVEDCPYTLNDFIIAAPYNPTQMYDEIIRLCKTTVTNNEEKGEKENKGIVLNNLVDIVEVLYAENKDNLLYWSAAKSMHHNYYAGLLYHTFRIMRTIVVLSKVYPNVNKEVLYCSAALHDIGKIRELITSETGSSEYSIDGELFGHTFIGLEMVNEVLNKYENHIDGEKIRQLKHCIAAHHGKKEFQAIQSPMTLEAFMLHSVDLLDSRVDMYENTLKDMGLGCISENVYGLGGKVYNPILE